MKLDRIEDMLGFQWGSTELDEMDQQLHMIDGLLSWQLHRMEDMLCLDDVEVKLGLHELMLKYLIQLDDIMITYDETLIYKLKYKKIGPNIFLEQTFFGTQNIFGPKKHLWYWKMLDSTIALDLFSFCFSLLLYT